jgi:hypothetical protein
MLKGITLLFSILPEKQKTPQGALLESIDEECVTRQ